MRRRYRDLLAEGLEETYEEILTRPVNSEGIPESFRVEELRRTEENLKRCLRHARTEDEKRVLRRILDETANRLEQKPVSLPAYNAALLMRFVVQVRQGGGEAVDRRTLEFICHIIEDVLSGAELDSVCPLPGRDTRMPAERTSQENIDLARWMDVNLTSKRFQTQAQASEAAAELWSVEPASALKIYKKFKGQLNVKMSSPKI